MRESPTSSRKEYFCVPDENENLNKPRFKIVDKPSYIAEGDRVIFTVMSELDYNGRGLYWKVKTLTPEKNSFRP